MKNAKEKKTSQPGNNLEATFVNKLIEVRADSHYYLVRRILGLKIAREFYDSPRDELYWRTAYHLPEIIKTRIKECNTLAPAASAKAMRVYEKWQEEIKQERQILNLKKTGDRTKFNEHIEYIYEFIENYKISNVQNLRDLAIACLVLGGFHYQNITTKDAARFLDIEERLRDAAYETIGYWTAKLEEMRKNHNNVGKRTEKKEERKELMRSWMETLSDKECNLKAQKDFDVTERTALTYIAEIKNKEKTTILRKKDDTS